MLKCVFLCTAEKLRDILHFYDVVVYDESLLDNDGDEPVRVSTDPTDRKNQIVMHLETCMEELAIAWGLDWQRIAAVDTVAPEPRLRDQKHHCVPRPSFVPSPPWSQASSPYPTPQMSRQRSDSSRSRHSESISSYEDRGRRPPPPQYPRS